MKRTILLLAYILSILFISCDTDNNDKQFTLLSIDQTGIDFNNQLNEDNSFNYFTYPYIYMGGGVSVGDINNDNLDDIYFTGNMTSNKLYLNKGNLNFESGFKSNEPIFVLGLPRAGSTLLEQILASHSKIEGTQELGNIMTIGRRIRTSNNSEDYLNNLLNLDDKSIKSHGKSYLDETQWAREGKDFFIDKMPNNFPHIGLIKMILPNAKIIDARRNPMDGCFSCFKQYFAKGQHFTYDLDDIARYYKDYIRLMDYWKKLFPEEIFTIHYEQVIDNPNDRIRDLLEFCNVKFEDNCINFHKSKRPVKTASSEQVRQPMYKTGLDYWKNYSNNLDTLLKYFPEYN